MTNALGQAPVVGPFDGCPNTYRVNTGTGASLPFTANSIEEAMEYVRQHQKPNYAAALDSGSPRRCLRVGQLINPTQRPCQHRPNRAGTWASAAPFRFAGDASLARRGRCGDHEYRHVQRDSQPPGQVAHPYRQFCRNPQQ